MVATVVYARVFIETGACRHIGFDADDWFDTFRFTGFVEFDSTIEDTVISESERRHTELFCFFYQFRHLAHTVEEGIVTMGMEVDETHGKSIAGQASLQKHLTECSKGVGY